MYFFAERGDASVAREGHKHEGRRFEEGGRGAVFTAEKEGREMGRALLKGDRK